jgi:hypothetical protein
MAEVAIATQSVPPDWYYDDRMIVTLIDVMQVQAERAKRKRR